MDESLDSEAEARAKAEGRSCVPTEEPARGPASSNKRRRRRQRKVAAEEWSQLPLFSSMSSHASSPLVSVRFPSFQGRTP